MTPSKPSLRRNLSERARLIGALSLMTSVIACGSKAPAASSSYASAMDSVTMPTRPGPLSKADSALPRPEGPLMVSPKALQKLHEPEILHEVGGRPRLAPIDPAPLYVVNGAPLPFARAVEVLDSTGYSDFSAGSTWPDDFTSPEAQRYWLAQTGYAAYPAAAHGVIEITARSGRKRDRR